MEGQLVQLLAPFLSQLLAGAGEQVQEIGSEAVQTVWKHAKKVWDRLRPAVEAKEGAKEAATDVAAKPDDAKLQTVFEVQLGKLLEADAAMASDLAALLESARRDGVDQTTIKVAGDVITKATGHGKAFGVVGGNVTIDRDS
jgi:hypothetical protein